MSFKHGGEAMTRSPQELDNLIGTIDAIEVVEDKHALLDVTSSYLKRYGVKHVTMGLIMNPALVSNDVTQLGVSNFPDDFFDLWVMDAGADLGLGEGLVVPVFGPGQPSGMVSLALEERLTDPMIKATVEVPIIHAFNRLLDFIEPNIVPEKVELTLREIDVLHYVAAGKTNWEVGRVLGISENTVKKILQKVLTKYHTIDKIKRAITRSGNRR